MDLAAVIEALRGLVGDGAVSTGDSVLQSHSHDESTHDPVVPDVVVYPKTTEQVSAIAGLANESRIPVTAFGAGTGLEGHAIAVAGGIIVDFRDMNRIVELHAEDFQVTVQPGVLRLDLEDHLGRHGLFFPPDPGANASIGGMIATNAAGIRTVKYGATRDNVLALTAVLADGRVVRTGSRSVKQSAGYDLRHLIIGSEGTLGLVTEATLKLTPVPEHFATAIVAFDGVAAAASAAYEIMGHGLEPAALELLARDHMRWMNEDEGTDFVEATSLLVEFSGSSADAVADAMAMARGICTSGGGRDASTSERHVIWRLRHGVRERYVRRSAGKRIISVDVGVPISRLASLVEFAEAAGAAAGLDMPVLGHVGDGNVHFGIIFDPSDTAASHMAASVGEALVHRAIEMGGTSTGEHGVGLGKRRYLADEFGHEAVEAMRAIKKALDPHNILNPGKVLPDE